jgi:hypothetical protein
MLSRVAFNFNMRRCTVVKTMKEMKKAGGDVSKETLAGRCRLTLWNPC